MSYRFLPWIRQGLASRITDRDGLGPSVPNRARFPVRVSLSTGDSASVDLRLNGPGDVIGIDPRTIVRTEPPRFARNVTPDQFVAIEFDAPDLPWMFTPARADGQDRLRPWLVLVVVAAQDGVDVEVDRDRPLPQLVIEAPATPGIELPDLSESWAWAHSHIVESAAPTSVADHLADHPDQNVSRLLCPRRLEPDRDYLACLVPAFETGRLAGLGRPVPEAATTTPAWGATGGVGASIRLPLYFHWSFRTGPAGDFESLARRLTPRPVPDTVGFRKMFVGDAHPALPTVEPDDGGILKLEGALRAPDAGDSAPLPAQLQSYVEDLVDILNAPADHPIEGASADAESVAPPIYGGAHVKVERLDGSEHRWLGELNRDPRNRAAAGLGTEVVRQNQEQYMNAAWVQVGEVVAANLRLDRARLLKEILDRILRRHIEPLRADALLAFTGPVHHRVVDQQRSLRTNIAGSFLPDAVVESGFRRMASPRSPVLRRADRRAGGTGPVSSIDVVAELAIGDRPFDVLAEAPDGLGDSRLLARFGRNPTGDVGEEIGAPAAIPGRAVQAARAKVRQLSTSPVPADISLRPDLGISGIVVRDVVLQIRALTGPGLPLSDTLLEILDASRDLPHVIGLAVDRDPYGALRFEPMVDEDRLVRPREPRVRPARPTGPGRPAPPAPRPTVPGRPGIPTGPIGPGRPGGPGGPIGPGRPIDPRPRPPIDPTGRPVINPPVTDPGVLKRYDTAFEAHRAAMEFVVDSVIPPPNAFDLAEARTTLVSAIDPGPVVDVRTRMAIRIADRPLLEGLADLPVRQEEPLDPIMVGPQLPEPLYRALADHDPDRFLPGIGDIPDDTITMLETNPRFVEAFLIGANHEMNRELLWRRYPTDRRGTPFRKFWQRVDGGDDIPPIHGISRRLRLGTSTGADLDGSLTLLVRGQLLRRYPNAVVYATPSLADGTLDPDPAAAVNPIFWGRLSPDVTFVGFDLTRDDVGSAPGWFFVIAEQPTEARFGLDVPLGGGGPLVSWSDLTWAHVGVDPGGHLRLVQSGLMNDQRDVVAGGPRATFGRNSAHMAAITFQRPFRAAVHSSEIIDGAEGPGAGTLRPILTHARLLQPIDRGVI